MRAAEARSIGPIILTLQAWFGERRSNLPRLANAAVRDGIAANCLTDGTGDPAAHIYPTRTGHASTFLASAAAHEGQESVITRLGEGLCPLEQFEHVIHDARILATLLAGKHGIHGRQNQTIR
jgi:hypothetical protein